MNKDRFKGNGKQIKDGQEDQLIGKLQERYGYAKDKARDAVEAFSKEMPRAEKRPPAAPRSPV